LPSSIGSCADKLMLRTRPLSVQLMPPHEHGDASEAFQSSSRGGMAVKALLNSINAKPSGVKPTAIPTTHVSKLTRTKCHLGVRASKPMFAIEPRYSLNVYLSRNGSVRSRFIHIYPQKCAAMVPPKIQSPARPTQPPACHPSAPAFTDSLQRSRNMFGIRSKNTSTLLVMYTEP
jgi:hypothetical protein